MIMSSLFKLVITQELDTLIITTIVWFLEIRKSEWVIFMTTTQREVLNANIGS